VSCRGQQQQRGGVGERTVRFMLVGWLVGCGIVVDAGQACLRCSALVSMILFVTDSTSSSILLLLVLVAV